MHASSQVASVGDKVVHLQHLIGPEGEVLIQYEAAARPDQIGQSIADEMADYKRKNPAWHGCVHDLHPFDNCAHNLALHSSDSPHDLKQMIS